MEKLKQIKANLDNLDKEYKQIRADMPESSSNEMYYKIMENCYQMVSSLRNYVYSVEDSLIEHKTKNHVPPLDAGAMQRFLELVELDDNYEVVKPKIMVKASRNGHKEFEVELDIKSE